MQNFLTTTFVSIVFFLSGGCALVYESLWTRYLTELTGGTALSQLIVLIVFMGGLSLGAVLVGRLVDKRRVSGLVIYGVLETGIGLYAILFPLLYNLLSQIYLEVGADLGSGSAGLLGFKVLLSFLLIIGPSVAMGGTLPAVSRYLTTSFEGLRANIGLLYGVNSLGAVIGILAAGFFLIYHYGKDASMQYTGVFNLAIGLAALAFARYGGVVQTGTVAASSSSPDECSQEKLDCLLYEPAMVRVAIITAGLAGFAAMALQVAWIRYYVIFLGATHSSFTIVVAAFIFGIGLGSLLVKTKFFGRIPLPHALVTLLLLATTFIWLQLFFYGRMPFEISRFLGIIAPTPFAWPFYSVVKFGILFCFMLLPTLASGMILPVCIRIAERGNELIGRDVARIYAANTIASLLGILVTGQLLFRMLSLPRTLQAILLIYIATTLFLAFTLSSRGRKPIVGFLFVLVVVHFLFWRPWSPDKLFVHRVEFGQTPPLSYKGFVQSNANKSVIKDLQGPDAQVTVLERQDAEKSHRFMYINGKSDAGTATDMQVQVLQSHLPALLHPDPDTAFVLGLGSGITSGEILKFESISKVVTAELVPEVFAASKAFAEYNDRFWENPRHRLVLEDGMTFLRLAKEKYDVITLEPTNMWQAGMAGLFSEDFFRLVRSRLKPGGVVSQWVHLYMVEDLALDLVLKAFSRVFPNSSIFRVDQGNILLIGYDEKWQFDAQRFKQRFYLPQILASFNQLGYANPAALLLKEVLDRNSFYEYTTLLSTPINTLDFPILEQAAEYGRFRRKLSQRLWAIDSRLDPDGGNMLLHEYAGMVDFDLEQKKNIVDLELFDRKNKLENSLELLLLDALWNDDQVSPPLEALSSMRDSQLREVVTHPNYRKAPQEMTANEAYNILGAELMVWDKAASQFWTPDPDRLHQLYDRLALETDQETAGTVARKAAMSLALGQACRRALPFFRIAEAKGQLVPEKLSAGELAVIFSCEVKAGEPEKARRWWQIIEARQPEVTAAMQRDKDILEIKGGGLPPPPIYGRLPSLW